MAPIQIKQFLFVGALCAGSAFLTTACVDNSYDLSEDLDLTMGLGSNGLSVPMGNVEKIYLNDILYVSSNGLITSNCDMSYDDIDKSNFGNLDEFIKKCEDYYFNGFGAKIFWGNHE